MSLEVAPVELEFRIAAAVAAGPFNREVSQTIHLANRNETPVAFKVKTTAPKRYCVRPNSGRIEPGTVVEVQVLLQAMKEEPPLDQRCRDKFLVQSVAVPADKDFANVSAIWQHADAHRDQERPFECKIKVAFLPPLGDEAPDSRQSSDAAQRSFHDEPPAYSPAA
ncbi:phosphatidylinositol-binding protein scs2, partial [Ascosphaera acerosa]